MKTRQGFVSNSSSSSFIINPTKISKDQYDKLQNFIINECHDGWSFYNDEVKGLISGYTHMDNGDLSEWLEKNNMEHLVQFEGGY